MPIYYTLIANKIDNVLCEYTDKEGNFQQISRMLLAKAVDKDTNQALVYSNHKFHAINDKGVTYLCLSDNMDDKIIISFLKDVQLNLNRQYDSDYILAAPAYKLSAFEKQIKELVEYYETSPRKSVTGNMINELNETKSLVVKNISTLLDRENTLELTIKNSERLKDSSIKVLNYVRLFN